MKFENRLSFLLLGAALAGCGGSTGSATGLGSVGTTTTFGDAKVAYSGSAKPAVLDFESGLSVSTFAGVSISSLAMYPAANVANAPVYYLSNGALYSYQRGAVQPVIEQANHYFLSGDVSTDGHFYFEAGNSNAAVDQLGRCKLDGSTYTGFNFGINPRVSPDGTKIVFDTGAGGLSVESSSGGTATVLDDGGFEGSVSPDGTKVAYVRLGATNYQIFTIPIGGGALTQVTSDALDHFFPTWSPDGSLILCDVDNDSTERLISSYYANGASPGYPFVTSYFQTAAEATGARFSPDGKYLAAITTSSYGGSDATVTISDLGQRTSETVASGTQAIWAPYLSSKTFVGTNAELGTTASGFIYSQFQPGFASLLIFTATTPSKATATLVSGGNTQGPAVYDLHADSVTAIKYANGYWQSPASVTAPSTDALASVDTTTGLITSVSPFVQTRGNSLTKSSGAGSVSYKAHFLGVWDAHGKNVAPNGASVLTLDSKKGSIVSVQ